MTHKDKVHAKANAVIEAALAQDVCLSETECGIVQGLVRAAWVEAERETLLRVDHYYSHHIHHDMDDYPDKFIKWVRSQQQELER